jgi:hypothetical protein
VSVDWYELLAIQVDATVVRVKSRERTDLEFKATASQNSVAKCVKTIAAFANCGGGRIVFGVGDRPRTVCGCSSFPDEADIQNLLRNHLFPTPDIEVTEIHVEGYDLFVLSVKPLAKPPTIAIKDLQTNEGKNKTVLSQGVIYYRRSGQSSPATGEEFSALLDKRDEIVRNSILSFLARGREVGFENVAVADFRRYGSGSENVTLWVPEAAAKDLNIVDRAKLVESDGAPAYQIRGSVNLTLPSDRDPRKPLLPAAASRALREFMKDKFWEQFPWSETHLRKATTHLGFWQNLEGDGRHTGFEHLTKRPLYYEEGRAAVQRFANRTPNEFIDVVGSASTKSEWRRRQRTVEAEQA